MANPSVFIVVVGETAASDVAVVVDRAGKRLVLAGGAWRGRIEVYEGPQHRAEIRVVLILLIGPASDDLAHIIDARRIGERGARIIELEVGSVRVSQKRMWRAVAIPGETDDLTTRIDSERTGLT